MNNVSHSGLEREQKEFKGEKHLKNKEVEMRLLGRGYGYFGLRKSKNLIFIITTILGILAIAYGILIKSFPLFLGAFAIYLMIVSFLARD